MSSKLGFLFFKRIYQRTYCDTHFHIALWYVSVYNSWLDEADTRYCMSAHQNHKLGRSVCLHTGQGTCSKLVWWSRSPGRWHERHRNVQHMELENNIKQAVAWKAQKFHVMSCLCFVYETVCNMELENNMKQAGDKKGTEVSNTWSWQITHDIQAASWKAQKLSH